MLSGFQAFVLLSIAAYASGWLYYVDHGKRRFWWSLIWPIAIWLDHKVLRSMRSKAQEREMSIEALERFPHPDVPPGKSILFQIATELGIPHQYSDPNSAIQEQLDILHLPKAKNGYAREAYWLRQLKDLHLFPCLFVLGVCHTRSFPNLLATSGFKPIVLTKEWKP